jgi:DNA-binding response OmpR family regulator
MQPKVLLVEDDRFVSSMLKSRLERDGFSVEQAFDGDEGVQKMRSVRPDLVILDVILPKMSGFEFLERVVGDTELAGIPVMVVSNLGQETDVEKARSLGAIDYYVKARTSIDDLENVVKNRLKNQAAPQSEKKTP